MVQSMQHAYGVESDAAHRRHGGGCHWPARLEELESPRVPRCGSGSESMCNCSLAACESQTRSTTCFSLCQTVERRC
jgi:hypothetical protein